MAKDDNPKCPKCGQNLDIVIDPKTGKRTAGGCINPDCPGNTHTPKA